jgi:hypothetical protein
MNMQQKMVIAIVDVVVIVELCIGMYMASSNPDNLTPAFVKSFFSMLIPTLIVAKLVINRFRSVSPEPVQ